MGAGPIDSFLNDYIEKPLHEVGFKRQQRTFVLEGGHVAVALHLRAKPTSVEGFFLEWGLVPTSSVGFYTSARRPYPRAGWGMVTGRIEVPEERWHYGERWLSQNWWFELGKEQELVPYFLDRVLSLCFPVWLKMFDREYLLRALNEPRPWPAEMLGGGTLAHTPRGPRVSYIALYLDDGDIEVLRAKIEECVENRYAKPEWTDYWSRRLDERVGV